MPETYLEIYGARASPSNSRSHFVPWSSPRLLLQVSHTAKQTPPIQLGTSGGWRYDLANGYCCGGTLGSLVQIGGTQYILSNYHVFESDIVSGGNNRVATTGDPIIQPGLIDVGCNASKAQTVATLVKKSSLPNSNVDASIAQVVPGMVRTDGAILEIGTISAQTVAAAVTQAVKKSGRTTGLTRSTISGLNATVSVAYDNECAGGTAFTKTFTGQIIISNKGSKFLAAGDSGSLMVEDVATNPRAVGLLFAGSSTLAVANPIGDVLNFFGRHYGGPIEAIGFGANEFGAIAQDRALLCLDRYFAFDSMFCGHTEPGQSNRTTGINDSKGYQHRP